MSRAVVGALLLGALAACGGESGALVTFTLSADDMAALRSQAGIGGEVRGELFVARGAGGLMTRDVLGAGDDGGDSRVFDDVELVDGFTVRINDDADGEVTVALAVWAEPAMVVDDIWVPSQHFFVARTVTPTGGLRHYAAPLGFVDAITRRRLDCGDGVEPGPDGAQVWWGARRAGADACVGWIDGDQPSAIVVDPVGDPDCDGAPAAAPPECAVAGQQQCWSDLADGPAEDVDGDGYVADVAAGPGLRLVADANGTVVCEPCPSGQGCECAPGDADRNQPQVVAECSADVCERPAERRCVADTDTDGAACIAGWYDCGLEACVSGDADVTGMICDAGSLAIDCSLGACEVDDADAVRFACARAKTDVGDVCSWSGEVGPLLPPVPAGATCSAVRLWGGAAVALEIWGNADGGPRAVLDGSEDGLLCQSLTLNAPNGGGAPGEAYVLLEFSVDGGGSPQHHVVPFEIAAANGACDGVGLGACAEIPL